MLKSYTIFQVVCHLVSELFGSQENRKTQPMIQVPGTHYAREKYVEV